MKNAAAIAEKLAGHPVNPRGRNYLVCCPAHEDNSPSLSLCDGDRGLKVHCFAGCSPADIYAAIRAKVGEIGAAEPNPQAAKGSSEYERQQHEKARWLWSWRRPIGGTIAEKYLRSRRRIACPLPPTLAFLPARKPDQHPAMISAFGICTEFEPGVIVAPRDVIAVHLTLLKPDGGGKAEIEKPKLVIGSPSGRPIVIAPANDLLGLAITEGIEDGLTAHQVFELGAWAAGSAPHMAKLGDAVPDYIEAVTIYAHADKAGQDGANKLAAKLRERGIEVTIEGLDRDG